MKKTLSIILVVIIILTIAAGAYWYFLMKPVLDTAVPGSQATDTTSQSGFSPFDRPGASTGGNATDGTPATTDPDGTPVDTTGGTPAKLPTLRLLSSAPVGGYGASTTKSATVVRWVDRGRGNVYEANYQTPTVTTLSNTIVPRTYESVWNKNLNSFIASLFQDGDSAPATVYAQLLPVKVSTTSTSQTPYELKGKNLPKGVIGYAVSPDKSKLFLLIEESGNGVGYTSTFDGQNMTRIFTTPFTEVNVEWPSANTIALTTKGSASSGGFLYFVNPTTGAWTKILGPIAGLSTVVSHDAKYVLYSAAGRNSGIATNLFNVSKGIHTDAVVRTLADKCAWGNFYKETAYCAVPAQPTPGTYPDDWYSGKLSTTDKIWQIDAGTGNVRQISGLIDQSDRVIDGFNLGLDNQDDYLFFMNKNDLSLWSLDLVKSP